MISAHNLNVSYGQKHVLKNIQFELEEGLVHGLVGLNGSGKTTLLNTIYGIKKADSGHITRNGAKLSKRDMAYVEAENYFYSYITGSEFLKLIKNDTFDNALWQQLFNIELNERIDSYSTGMKKKLAILFGLKINKPILILDEPFNGLDIESVQVLKLIIANLKSNGHTVIITSHIMEVLPDFCDDIIHIEQGEIKKIYPVGEFPLMKTALYGSIEENVNEQIKKSGITKLL